MFKAIYSACLALGVYALLINPSCTNAFNCTASEYSVPVTSSFWRVGFVFNCYPTTASNQLFPSSYSLQSTKFNEIDLSPNFYTAIPIAQLCPFKYTITLDLSFNRLTSLTGAFRNLACLTGLKTINFGDNLISTPILASDFDETFSSQLESLNFTNNLIPSIQTAAFIRSDGTSRFPNLNFLGLAKNKLIQLDLLWPLSLQSQNLFIDLKLNPISVLTNELKLTYNNILFRYPMTANRRLDATTNSLQYLDDSNMIQYGLYNENDLREFLYKMSNYDLRQSNFVRTFLCHCPTSSGQLVVYWFKIFSTLVDKTRPIYQLYCSGYEGLVYIFDHSCGFTTPYSGPSTTTYSTVSNFIVPNFTMQFENLLANNQTTTVSVNGANAVRSDGTNSANSTINYNYFYLFFLFVPFFMILILMFIFCCGRCCQLRTNRLCNLTCCPCARPHDESKYTGKYYDATICFSRFDEHWLDEQFIPEIMHYENNFKIHKLSVISRKSEKQMKDNERVLRASKRIILVFTLDFLEADFKNQNFINILREAKNDPNCVIIALNKNLDKSTFKYCVDYLNVPCDFKRPDMQAYLPKRSIFSIIKSRIKYNCGLREVEKLNFRERNFWRKFFYMMPFVVYDNTKPSIITDSARLKDDFKLPKLPTRHKQFTDEDSTGYEKKNYKLSYASEYKNNKRSRHVIIPIPEFMRTTLGFSKKNKTHLIGDSNANKNNSARTNIFSIQQQEEQGNAFSSIPFSNSATPDSMGSSRISGSSNQNLIVNNNKANLALQSPYYQNKLMTVNNQQSMKIKSYSSSEQERNSRTPDILASFAPQPNAVFKLESKKSKTKSKRSSRRQQEEYPDNLEYSSNEMDA